LKEIKSAGAQGDVLFVRINDSEMPSDAKPVQSTDRIIIAHSDNGHHHVVQAESAQLHEVPGDQFTRYLRVASAFADVVHQRPFDTHETVRLSQGTWMVRRQREYTPDGFRRVED
jgi:hypothetical protein